MLAQNCRRAVILHLDLCPSIAVYSETTEVNYLFAAGSLSSSYLEYEVQGRQILGILYRPKKAASVS